MSTFINPPGPDQLGDLSWRRLEQSLFLALEELELEGSETTTPRWRRRALLGGGVAIAAVAAAALLYVSWPGSESSVTGEKLARLVTHESASSMTVGDASLRADAHTALLVADGGDRGISVILERGAVDCAVARRPGRAPFRVIAGEVVVEVTGTRFRVERAGDSARVSVSEGVVSVLAGGVLRHVAAGERWPDETASAAPVKPDPPVVDEATRAPDKAKAKPKPKLASAKERYAAAARLESSDPGAALAIYRRLAREGGSWAATALFAQARLELERGDKRRARRSLERYLRKHPDGLNARDARNLLRQLR